MHWTSGPTRVQLASASQPSLITTSGVTQGKLLCITRANAKERAGLVSRVQKPTPVITPALTYWLGLNLCPVPGNLAYHPEAVWGLNAVSWCQLVWELIGDGGR